jgi:alkanesulfonate monooxygenase SsuD/methylene tetrahydromethanopterin reductase-like flavin-dependent oxidoreductase (luciferase family)
MTFDDYDELFEEKLELLLQLREKEIVTWEGKHRPSLQHLAVYPRPVQHPLPVWIAVGGTTASVIRAAKLQLPMAIAIIGGTPDRFVPLVELYRETAHKAGHHVDDLKVSINSHTYIADNTKQAGDEFYPSYAEVMTRLGRERGWSPMNRQQFDMMRAAKGALLVGSVQEVIDKVMYEYELFHHDRFLAQLSVGTMPHDKVMHAIELLGTKVAPVVKKEISSRNATKN